MVEILLILILLALFLIYRALGQLRQGTNDKIGISDRLESLDTDLYKLLEKASILVNYFTVNNPAGNKSDRYKRMNNLIKIYAQHLTKTKKVKEKEALIRARFEFHEFGEEKIIEEIDEDVSDGVYWKEREKAEEDYYASGLLEGDIQEYSDYRDGYEKKPAPYYLAAPMYAILVKQIEDDVFQKHNYEKTHEIEMNRYFAKEDSYYDFVKNRAIIYHLERLGIIKKTNREKWGGMQKWTIPDTYWQSVKAKIYGNEDTHEDSYFEEQYNKGELERLFMVVWS